MDKPDRVTAGPGVTNDPDDGLVSSQTSGVAESGQNRRRRLEITNRPIADLKLDPVNPRRHSPRQIRHLKQSINAFEFNVPMLVDGDLHVISGHARLVAARGLGMTHVPTICLEHLTEPQVRAFKLADNRIAELAEWDDVLLAPALKALADLELEFSLESTGFTMAEIDLHIEGLGGECPTPDPMDSTPPLSPGPTVCEVGDMWRLGKHGILCGDARDSTAYATLMADRTAAMVFSDPPYNVPISGHVSGLGAIRHPEFAMASGEMSSAEFTAFLVTVLMLMAQYSIDGALHYICIDWRHVGELLAAGRSVYSKMVNLCVWAKDNAGMGSFYRSQHELILLFKHGHASHRNNIELGRFGRYRTNVWHYLAANSFARTTEEGNLLALHPTTKPVALVADAILDCTARGDVVLDGFLGSGTTLIAAERVGRRCYGLEIDPRYVDVAIRRWQKLTGKNAYHAATGQTFSAKAMAKELVP